MLKRYVVLIGGHDIGHAETVQKAKNLAWDWIDGIIHTCEKEAIPFVEPKVDIVEETIE